MNHKLRVNKCFWEHHLSSGGWGWVSNLIYKKFNNNNAKIDLYTAYEYQVRNNYLNGPCIAIFHQVISGYERSLENLISQKNWRHNKQKIIGAITVSHDQAEFLSRQGIKNISCILHPTPLNVGKWKLDNFLKTNRIIHIGVHCRNLEFFSRLAHEQFGGLNYFYVMVKKKEVEPEFIRKYKVPIISRLSDNKFNKILKDSIVFLQLDSATANNTVLECIARGTPIIINPKGGIMDYLGKNYPLYYRSYGEAANLIRKIKSDPKILVSTQNFLEKIKSKFHKDKFIQSLENKIKRWL